MALTTTPDIPSLQVPYSRSARCAVQEVLLAGLTAEARELDSELDAESREAERSRVDQAAIWLQLARLALIDFDGRFDAVRREGLAGSTGNDLFVSCAGAPTSVEVQANRGLLATANRRALTLSAWLGLDAAPRPAINGYDAIVDEVRQDLAIAAEGLESPGGRRLLTRFHDL